MIETRCVATISSAHLLFFSSALYHADMPKPKSGNYRAIPEYYDAEYDRLDIWQVDLPFFMSQLPTRRQKILELCAGTARAAIPIVQAGHHVTGIDIADDMLAIGRRKRDGVGIPEKSLPLIEADALTLRLNEKFDWVCLFFNTFLNFTTLPEQDAILQTARHHLKPNGRFWIDIYQPNLELLAQTESIDLEPTTFFVPELERTVYRATEVRRDPAAQLQQVTFRYTWFDKNGQEKQQAHRFHMTFMFPRELQLLLERNGLQIESLYGNHDGSPLSAESPRMIACAKLAR